MAWLSILTICSHLMLASSRTCGTVSTCAAGAGRCVLRQCRDDIEALVRRSCPSLPDAAATRACQCTASTRAALSCRILSCIDDSTGARVDGRLRMVSR